MKGWGEWRLGKKKCGDSGEEGVKVKMDSSINDGHQSLGDKEDEDVIWRFVSFKEKC